MSKYEKNMKCNFLVLIYEDKNTNHIADKK